jgi:enoyl-CoA hydratase/carnithine racemase
MTTTQQQDQENNFPTEPEVIFTIQGVAGLITLNRPKALNAINLDMIRQIYAQLKAWETDSRVAFVVIEGAGGRAFCAGGDVRSVYAARLRDDRTYMDHIFREEYQMNYEISKYPKPYISLINGICMGGGMGLSIHGSYRVVTDDTVMAMPETSIGYFTDIGASYFLNQCPGKMGLWMGLTGEKIKVGDCLYGTLATHYVPQSEWGTLRDNVLESLSAYDAIAELEMLSQPAPISALKEYQSLMDEMFSGSSVEGIIEHLDKSQNAITYEWLKAMVNKSPTSMKMIYTLLLRTKGLPLKKCLPLEFRLSQRFVDDYDFFEGVRALLIDKDNRPQWQPSTLKDVTPAIVKKHFSPLKGEELVL